MSSGYVLDGIPTRMVEDVRDWSVNCECGFRCPPGNALHLESEFSLIGDDRRQRILRFHYQNCPEARLPRGAADEVES